MKIDCALFLILFGACATAPAVNSERPTPPEIAAVREACGPMVEAKCSGRWKGVMKLCYTSGEATVRQSACHQSMLPMPGPTETAFKSQGCATLYIPFTEGDLVIGCKYPLPALL